MNDPEVRKIIRYIGSVSEDSPLKSAVANVIKLIGDVDKDKMGTILKEDFKWLFKGIEHFKDYYDALRKAIEKDPSNQPLCILLGEECQKRKIPFVLATSTYHHDELTQPITNYCSRNGWILIDCPPNLQGEKTSTAFWERAYDALLREMKK
jgi:hypothetical protein